MTRPPKRADQNRQTGITLAPAANLTEGLDFVTESVGSTAGTTATQGGRAEYEGPNVR
jgi:hypothetical protein